MDDGTQVWICDYVEVTPLPPTPSEPNETTVLRCVISGNASLKNGYKRPYSVKFTDKDENTINWENINFKWNIVNDPGLITNAYENKIDILFDDEDSIGSSFLLQVIVEGKILAESKITIIE